MPESRESRDQYRSKLGPHIFIGRAATLRGCCAAEARAARETHRFHREALSRLIDWSEEIDVARFYIVQILYGSSTTASRGLQQQQLTVAFFRSPARRRPPRPTTHAIRESVQDDECDSRSRTKVHCQRDGFFGIRLRPPSCLNFNEVFCCPCRGVIVRLFFLRVCAEKRMTSVLMVLARG